MLIYACDGIEWTAATDNIHDPQEHNNHVHKDIVCDAVFVKFQEWAELIYSSSEGKLEQWSTSKFWMGDGVKWE